MIKSNLGVCNIIAGIVDLVDFILLVSNVKDDKSFVLISLSTVLSRRHKGYTPEI